MEDRNLYFTDMDGENVYSGSDSGVLCSQSIDLATARNIGVGSHKVFCVVEVTDALVGANDSLDIDFVTADNAALTSSLVVIKQTAIQFAAAAAEGTRDYFEVPESFNYKEFIGIRVYARGSGAPSAGAIRARLSLEPGVRHLYTSASTLG
ncbi:MAG TPA: hypothetical protein VHE12_05825 [bacterium]|nr:hypothetical protein [bacterium]